MKNHHSIRAKSAKFSQKHKMSLFLIVRYKEHSKNLKNAMHTIFLDQIDSTQTFAKENYTSFPEGQITCVVADEQTQGRGRWNRNWVSPKEKNLYITYYFSLPRTSSHLSSLASLLCVTLVQVLEKMGFSPQIKWPNDILLSYKKLSGVLCETSFQEESIAIFLGIGINVNMDKEELSSIDQIATSLFAESEQIQDRTLLLDNLNKKFARNLKVFQKKGFFSFLSFLDSHLAYKKKRVALFDGNKRYEGVVDSISEEGALNLFFEKTKETKSFFSGDLFPIL